MAYLSRIHRTHIPETTGAHVLHFSQKTPSCQQLIIIWRKQKLWGRAEVGWQHHWVVQTMTHSCSGLKRLCSISLRSTWWLLCRGKKARDFAISLKEKENLFQFPASSSWLQTTALSKLSMVPIGNCWLVHPCAGLFTTLITSSITYEAIKGWA